MKRTLLTILCTLAVVALVAPYFIGRLQMNNVIAVCQNLMNDDTDTSYSFGSDGDIVNTLAVFGFELDVMDKPDFADYYKAGLRALAQ